MKKTDLTFSICLRPGFAENAPHFFMSAMYVTLAYKKIVKKVKNSF